MWPTPNGRTRPTVRPLSDSGHEQPEWSKPLRRLIRINESAPLYTPATLVKEPVAKAFERLREDLRPLTRYSGIEIEFIEPPLNGRALPGEVAHAARAIVRGLVLSMTEQTGRQQGTDAVRLRRRNLLINVRDNGPASVRRWGRCAV